MRLCTAEHDRIYISAACFALMMISRGKCTIIFVCYAAATIVLADITRASQRDVCFPGQHVHPEHAQDPEVKISASSFTVLPSPAARCTFHLVS
jgi:hypothetical protein